MYNVAWFIFPNGIKDEKTIMKIKKFEKVDNAINYLREKCKSIDSLNWQCGVVIDINLNWIFDINIKKEERMY